MKGHGLWMVIGCLLPLLLLFLLPLLGFTSLSAIFIAIILMLALHVLMTGAHGRHDDGNQQEGGHGSH